MAHLVENLDDAFVSNCVADPEPRERIELGERPKRDDAVSLAEQRHGIGVIGRVDVFEVRLIEYDEDVVRKICEKRVDFSG